MSEAKAHILGKCKDCGFQFDLYFGFGCPACRSERVKTLFKPTDPERTATAIYSDAEYRQRMAEQEFQQQKDEMGRAELDGYKEQLDAWTECIEEWQRQQAEEGWERSSRAFYDELMGTERQEQHSKEPEQAEVPRGCRIPKGEAAQIYELRRMFRL